MLGVGCILPPIEHCLLKKSQWILNRQEKYTAPNATDW